MKNKPSISVKDLQSRIKDPQSRIKDPQSRIKGHPKIFDCSKISCTFCIFHRRNNQCGGFSWYFNWAKIKDHDFGKKRIIRVMDLIMFSTDDNDMKY